MYLETHSPAVTKVSAKKIRAYLRATGARKVIQRGCVVYPYHAGEYGKVGGPFGKFVGITPIGGIWVCWQSTPKRFKGFCETFDRRFRYREEPIDVEK